MNSLFKVVQALSNLKFGTHSGKNCENSSWRAFKLKAAAALEPYDNSRSDPLGFAYQVVLPL